MLSIHGGDLYVGIMTVLNSIREIFGLAVMGITSGAQPVLGFNYGAKQYHRVKQGIRFTTLTGLIYTVAAWVLILIFAKPLFMMFSSDAAMLEKGVEALKIFFFGYAFMSFQFAGQSTFTALGKAKHAIFFSLLRKAFIVVPLTIVLQSPAGRPVQTTSDIGNFWQGSYKLVRNDLRGRYPKHDWPENP